MKRHDFGDVLKIGRWFVFRCLGAPVYCRISNSLLNL
jgi:hypothetical protein